MRRSLASFAMFFALLSAYYIIRPVRDEIGVTLGKDALHELFTVVFFVMIALVPLFGFVASRFPRRLVLPAIYIFFASNLVVFWFAMKAAPDNLLGRRLVLRLGQRLQSFRRLALLELDVGALVARGSEAAFRIHLGRWHRGRSRRTVADAGARQALAPADLLLVSAALLLASMSAGLAVRSLRPEKAGRETEPAGGGILDGAIEGFYDAAICAHRAVCFSGERRRYVFLFGASAPRRPFDSGQCHAHRVFFGARSDCQCRDILD